MNKNRVIGAGKPAAMHFWGMKPLAIAKRHDNPIILKNYPDRQHLYNDFSSQWL
ncbi:TPA: hypothetical protein HA361_03800 [Candidatus Woesearchaeota archaeon]|nr:hypothetical protein [Candidatus Woesearchaeota archaeon]HII68826.1 hypothetical protein [Candidatus Woesearchaeota archaeon]